MAKKTAKKSARKPNAAFMKPMTPSAALSEVVGSKPIPRTEVTKKLWLYIKKNKQLKSDKQKPECIFAPRRISQDGESLDMFRGFGQSKSKGSPTRNQAWQLS